MQEIIKSLHYRKVCSHVHWPKLRHFWKLPTPKSFFRDLKVKEMIFTSILTGDESWFHHYKPETKLQSMEWQNNLDSPSKKTVNTEKSIRKLKNSLFWDAEGCILVGSFEPSQIINAARYIQVLLKIHREVCKDNTATRKREASHCSCHWEDQDSWVENSWYPPYSPDLVPFVVPFFKFS